MSQASEDVARFATTADQHYPAVQRGALDECARTIRAERGSRHAKQAFARAVLATFAAEREERKA